jgi:hypothetical protein
VLLSSHTDAYVRAETDRALYDNGFCNGFAFVGDTGLVAVTRGRPIRPTVASISLGGHRLTDEQPAFPDADASIDQIAVTAQAGRFAWAGYVREAASVPVAFGSGPAPERSVDLPGEMAPDGRPRIEPWPFSDGVTVSWQETSLRARVVAVDEDGTRRLEHVIERPDALAVSRPEIAPTPHGLVIAYSVSREPEPEVVIELFGADGRLRAEPIVIAAAGAFVWSAVALGDVVLVVWSGAETADDASGFAHSTGFYGALFRTAP